MREGTFEMRNFRAISRKIWQRWRKVPHSSALFLLFSKISHFPLSTLAESAF